MKYYAIRVLRVQRVLSTTGTKYDEYYYPACSGSSVQPATWTQSIEKVTCCRPSLTCCCGSRKTRCVTCSCEGPALVASMVR